MNETLEAMARALFKSWFVDFDPVRAKAEGRDTLRHAPMARRGANRRSNAANCATRITAARCASTSASRRARRRAAVASSAAAAASSGGKAVIGGTASSCIFLLGRA